MSTKLDNSIWEEYINKFTSYKGTITVKNFCIENLMPWSNKIPENMKIKDRK